ncbi:MAG: CidA/LrgA family protein [Eubacteriales bacterium]|nr:CidA/LrgA family protein [Eubacteriales bacterium]
MKLLYQFGVILAVTFLGEVLHGLLPLPVPASIYGLVLMLLALCTKIIKLENVKIAADFLLEIMPPMFIPAAVGLLTAWAGLKEILVPVVVITVVTTVLVMVVTGRVSQAVIRLKKGGEERE